MDNPTKRCWFACRTRNGQWKKTGRRLEELGVEHFIPNICNTLLFIHSDKPKALSLVNSGEINARFMIDRATHTLLEVPSKQMEDFFRVVNGMADAECSTEFAFAKGDRVRVIKGPLKGVEGEIQDVGEGTFLIVGILSLLFARVRIARGDIVPIA